MTLETVLIWVIVGAVAGVLADAVVGGMRVGLIGAIIVGIIGAIIGGWLFGQLNINIRANAIIVTVIEAFVGAVILLLILRGVRRV